jgi:hypothetical protein
MLNWIRKLLTNDTNNYSTVTLSNEEWFEIKKALQSNIRRDEEVIPTSSHSAVTNLPASVIDRAKHSISIQRAALMKLPG